MDQAATEDSAVKDDPSGRRAAYQRAIFEDRPMRKEVHEAVTTNLIGFAATVLAEQLDTVRLDVHGNRPPTANDQDQRPADRRVRCIA
jgi:hypothetical protein